MRNSVSKAPSRPTRATTGGRFTFQSRDDERKSPSSTATSPSVASPLAAHRSGKGASSHLANETYATKVFVRVRPFNARELSAPADKTSPEASPTQKEKHTSPIVRVDDSDATLITTLDPAHGYAPKDTYAFERCFMPSLLSAAGDTEGGAGTDPGVRDDQQTVYEHVGVPVLMNALAGYNGCVFAYGQTGSGKTYTMMGPPTLAGSGGGGPARLRRSSTVNTHVRPRQAGEISVSSPVDVQPPGPSSRADDEEEMQAGITPRLIRELFSRLHQKRLEDNAHSFRVELEYFEIYNERVMDLLHPPSPQAELRVRNSAKGPYVENLQRKHVEDDTQVFQWLRRGNVERHTAATRMNDRSSRSHAILSLHLVQMRIAEDDTGFRMTSKLNLVDLAGSERTGLSGVDGLHFKEATKINLSLTTLGRVVDALAELSRGKHGVFCPYRDSNLTWLLMDSLGGNSKTTMIATISPHVSSYEESCQTLRYAARAKQIINKVVVNEDPQQRQIKLLTAEVERLNQLLRGEDPGDEYVDELRDRLANAEAELEAKNAELEKVYEQLSAARSACAAANAAAAGQLSTNSKEANKFRANIARLEEENLQLCSLENELHRSTQQLQRLERSYKQLASTTTAESKAQKKRIYQLEREAEQVDKMRSKLSRCQEDLQAAEQRETDLLHELQATRRNKEMQRVSSAAELFISAGDEVNALKLGDETMIRLQRAGITADGESVISLIDRLAARASAAAAAQGDRASAGQEISSPRSSSEESLPEKKITESGDTPSLRELSRNSERFGRTSTAPQHQLKQTKSTRATVGRRTSADDGASTFAHGDVESLARQLSEKASAYRRSQLELKRLKDELREEKLRRVSLEKLLYDSRGDALRRTQKECADLKASLKEQKRTNKSNSDTMQRQLEDELAKQAGEREASKAEMDRLRGDYDELRARARELAGELDAKLIFISTLQRCLPVASVTTTSAKEAIVIAAVLEQQEALQRSTLVAEQTQAHCNMRTEWIQQQEQDAERACRDALTKHEQSAVEEAVVATEHRLQSKFNEEIKSAHEHFAQLQREYTTQSQKISMQTDRMLQAVHMHESACQQRAMQTVNAIAEEYQAATVAIDKQREASLMVANEERDCLLRETRAELDKKEQETKSLSDRIEAQQLKITQLEELTAHSQEQSGLKTAALVHGHELLLSSCREDAKEHLLRAAERTREHAMELEALDWARLIHYNETVCCDLQRDDLHHKQLVSAKSEAEQQQKKYREDIQLLQSTIDQQAATLSNLKHQVTDALASEQNTRQQLHRSDMEALVVQEEAARTYLELTLQDETAGALAAMVRCLAESCRVQAKHHDDTVRHLQEDQQDALQQLQEQLQAVEDSRSADRACHEETRVKAAAQADEVQCHLQTALATAEEQARRGDRLEAERDALLDEKEKLTRDLTEERGKLHELRTAYEDQLRSTTVQCTALSQKLDLQTEVHRQTQEELSSTKAHLEGVRQQLSEASMEVYRLTTECKYLNERINSEVKSHQEQTIAAASEREAHKEHHEHLRQQLEAAVSASNESAQELRGQQRQVQLLTESVSHLEIELRTAKSRLADCEKELLQERELGEKARATAAQQTEQIEKEHAEMVVEIQSLQEAKCRAEEALEEKQKATDAQVSALTAKLHEAAEGNTKEKTMMYERLAEARAKYTEVQSVMKERLAAQADQHEKEIARTRGEIQRANDALQQQRDEHAQSLAKRELHHTTHASALEAQVIQAQDDLENNRRELKETLDRVQKLNEELQAHKLLAEERDLANLEALSAMQQELQEQDAMYQQDKAAWRTSDEEKSAELAQMKEYLEFHANMDLCDAEASAAVSQSAARPSKIGGLFSSIFNLSQPAASTNPEHSSATPSQRTAMPLSGTILRQGTVGMVSSSRTSHFASNQHSTTPLRRSLSNSSSVSQPRSTSANWSSKDVHSTSTITNPNKQPTPTGGTIRRTSGFSPTRVSRTPYINRRQLVDPPGANLPQERHHSQNNDDALTESKYYR